MENRNITKINMTIKELKKELGLTDSDIAEFFQYKNTPAYSYSSAKPRIEAGIVSIIDHLKKEGWRKVIE